MKKVVKKLLCAYRHNKETKLKKKYSEIKWYMIYIFENKHNINTSIKK